MLMTLRSLSRYPLSALSGGIRLLDQLLERHREELDVVAQRAQVDVEIIAVDADRARLELRGRRPWRSARSCRRGSAGRGRCPTYPLPLARMWNQVGKPSMFEGNTFLPLHGIPIAYKRTQDDQVGRLAARAVDGPDPDRQVVDRGSDLHDCPARAGASSTAERVAGMMSSQRRRQRPALRAIEPNWPQAMGSRRASNHNKLEYLGRERRSLLLSPSHSTGLRKSTLRQLGRVESPKTHL